MDKVSQANDLLVKAVQTEKVEKDSLFVVLQALDSAGAAVQQLECRLRLDLDEDDKPKKG